MDITVYPIIRNINIYIYIPLSILSCSIHPWFVKELSSNSMVCLHILRYTMVYPQKIEVASGYLT